jgi:tetratricopeptide (TPR) repeat protein
MDVTSLTTFISPFLPFLLTLGAKTSETASEQLGEASWVKASAVWEKLSPKVEGKKAALEAVMNVANHPEDEDLQIALRVQLMKLLEQDDVLLNEIAQILETDAPNVKTGIQIVQNVTGNRNHVIGQVAGGKVISQSDFNSSICQDLKVNQNQWTLAFPENIKIVISQKSAPPSLSDEHSFTQHDYRLRMSFLTHVERYVERTLDISLQNGVFLELLFQERLDLLKRRWVFSEYTERELPEGTNVTTIFDTMGGGDSLLILGEPGCGKTTTLLKLAEDLVARSERELSEPIPVILNLSSWNSKPRFKLLPWASKSQSFEDWLVEELSHTYGVETSLGKFWVNTGRLILLLDGLDEVNVEQRKACVHSLNHFLETHCLTKLIVCCRIKEYQVLKDRLELRSAVCIQPLTLHQIDRFFDKSGNQLSTLKRLIHQNPEWQNLASSPSMLSIMSLPYQKTNIEPVFLKWPDQKKKRLGLEEKDVATTLDKLAKLYEDQCHYKEAELLYTQSLQTRKKLLGSNHPDVATNLNNLAELYDNQGRYKEAESLYIQALKIKQKALGTGSLNIAVSLDNLALLYTNQGQYKKAEEFFTKVLTLKEKLLGSDHLLVAISLNNLAGLYASQGRYREAENLYIQVLQTKQKLLGQEHPNVANSLNNLASLYVDQGRLEEAEVLYIQALQINQRLLGREHPRLAISLNNLAGLYHNQGRYKEAEPLYIQALQISQELLGQEHPNVANSLNNLAELFSHQERYKEAQSLYIQALQINQKLLGQEHPNVANSLNNLASLYTTQCRHEEAEPLYLEALQIQRRLLGQEHPNVANSLNNLASHYTTQGRYEKAELLYLEALQMQRRLLGQEHPNIAISLNNIAGLYYKQGRYEEAEPLNLEALQMQRKTLGSDHPSVASSLYNLATLYLQQKNYEKGNLCLQQALVIAEGKLGPNHSFTQKISECLLDVEG